MMAHARKLLYRLLGRERYLRTISSAFLRMRAMRLLLRRFPDHVRILRDGLFQPLSDKQARIDGDYYFVPKRSISLVDGVE